MKKNNSNFNYKEYYYSVYDHKARWLTYYYQIKFIRKLDPENILEIGIGNGFVSNYLKKTGYSVTTLDVDKELKPDIVASVTSIPAKNNSFDMVLCSEVLEHLPYTEFIKSLKEISRVTRNYVLLSLPDSRHTLIRLIVKIPLVRQSILFLKLPALRKGKFDDHHYWEINGREYPFSKIKKDI